MAEAKVSLHLHCLCLSYRHHFEERYVKLATCIPSERSGVVGLKRTRIGFFVAVETSRTYFTGEEIVNEKYFSLRETQRCKELSILQNEELDFCILCNRQLSELAGMEYLCQNSVGGGHL